MANRIVNSFKNQSRISQLLIVMVLLGIPTLLIMVDNNRRPVIELSNRFSEALAQHDIEDAYLMTSQGYQRDLSAQAFRSMVQSTGLAGHQGSTWINCPSKGSLGFCTGTYLTATGKSLPLTISATGYPEGWQIDYIRFELDTPQN